MKHLLDTTALVAHALREAGADEAQALIEDEGHDLFISAVSLFELAGVLKRNGAMNNIPTYWETYRQITEVIPVDADIAQTAWNLRSRISKHLPIADAIIAATPQSLQATLVHRDVHLAQISQTLIPQIRLSDDRIRDLRYLRFLL